MLSGPRRFPGPAAVSPSRPDTDLDQPEDAARIDWALVLGFSLAAGLSFCLWFADLRRGPHHWIPDGHAEYAQRFARCLAEPGAESARALLAFAQSYYQASNALTDCLAGLLMTVTGTGRWGSVLAFMIVSLLASLVTARCLWLYLRDILQLSRAGARMGLFMLWFHVIACASILRPMTDATVLACSMALLYAQARVFREGPGRGLWLGSLWIGVLGMTAKLSFAVLLLVPIPVILLRAVLGERPGRGMLAYSLSLLAVPLLAWWGMMEAADLWRTLEIQSETLRKFRGMRNDYYLRLVLVFCGQAFWLLACMSFRRPASRWLGDSAFLLPGAWMCGHLCLVLIGGVPFLTRHFLPLTFALVILSAPAMAVWVDRRHRGRWVLWLLLGLNLLMIAYQLILASPYAAWLPRIGILQRLAYV